MGPLWGESVHQIHKYTPRFGFSGKGVSNKLLGKKYTICQILTKISALRGCIWYTLIHKYTFSGRFFAEKVYRIHFIHKYTPWAKFLVKSVIDTLFDPNIHHFEKILGYQGVYSIHFDTQIHLFGTILCRKCIGYTLYTITLLDPNFKKKVYCFSPPLGRSSNSYYFGLD